MNSQFSSTTSVDHLHGEFDLMDFKHEGNIIKLNTMFNLSSK